MKIYSAIKALFRRPRHRVEDYGATYQGLMKERALNEIDRLSWSHIDNMTDRVDATLRKSNYVARS